MDREADVIRSEISQTRADLDRKLTRLEARARELTPRNYARRLVQERRFEQILGSVLMLAGGMFAWRRRPRRVVH
jgi:hypothetical protein